MEVVAAAIGIVDIAARTSSHLWKLCESWNDAPKDVHRLRDKLVQAQQFFDSLRHGLHTSPVAALEKPCPRLVDLLRQGNIILSEFEGIIHRIWDGRLDHSTEAPQPLGKRRKLVWLTKAAKLKKLSSALSENQAMVYAELVAMNLSLSSQLFTFIDSSEANVIEHVDRVVEISTGHLMGHIHQSLRASTNDLLSAIETRFAHVDINSQNNFAKPLDSDSIPRYTLNTSGSTYQLPLRRLEGHEPQPEDRGQLGNSRSEAQFTSPVKPSDTPLSLNEDLGEAVSTVSSHLDSRFVEFESRLSRGIETLLRAQNKEMSLTLERIDAGFQVQNYQIKRLQTEVETAKIAAARSTGSWWTSAFAQMAAYKVSTSCRAISTCHSTCPCRCHTPYAYGNWSLSASQSIVGTVTMSFTGFAGNRDTCSEVSCREKTRRKSVRIHYRFPTWLANTALFFAYSSGTASGPEMLLRVSGRVNMMSVDYIESVFYYIWKHDAAGLRRWLEKYPQSVYDTETDFGSSTLYDAVRANDVEVIRVLVSAGADWFQPNDGGLTPMDRLFFSRLHGTNVAAEVEKFNQFPLDEYIEDAEYSDLDRVFLGILPLDIEDVLRKPTFASMMDHKSVDGTTPLHLAAAVGHDEAVRVLLESGVDPSLDAKLNETPLHWAIGKRSYKLVKMLLDAGADVNKRGGIQKSPPLHRATGGVGGRGGDLDITRLLLQHGANVHAVDSRGATAIQYVALRDTPTHIENAKLLLSHGASLTALDEDGDGPLVNAVVKRNTNMLKFLLDKGGYYTTSNHDESHMLHFLASAGNRQIFDMFRRVPGALRGLDVNQRDRYGNRPIDLLELRSDLGPEIRAGFQALLDTCSILSEGGKVADEVEMHDDDESIDEFFDAAEG